MEILILQPIGDNLIIIYFPTLRPGKVDRSKTYIKLSHTVRP